MSASRFQRRAGFLPIRKRVVIATEGARTEPIYFNGLFKRPDSVLQILVLGSPRRGAKSSPQAVLARLEQAAAQDRRTGDQFWVVIDRDQWQPRALDEVAKRCRESSFELAVSNPCFEYWLYLHFAEPREFNSCIECHQALRRKYLGFEKTNFDPEEFRPGLSQAVKRAEKLDQRKADAWPQQTGTRVYRLVARLIRP